MKTYLLGRSFFDLTSAQPDGSDADTKDPAGRDLSPKGPAERIPLSGKFFHRLKAYLAGRLGEPSLPLASLLIALSQQVLVVPSIGQDFPPKTFEPDRYQTIAERDPFGSKLIPIRTPPKPYGEWAKGMVLLSVTRINGKYVVHVRDTTDAEGSKSHRLVEGSDDSELSIVAVKPHRDPAQVEVVVISKRDGETKTAVLMYAPSESKKKRSTLPRSRRVTSDITFAEDDPVQLPKINYSRVALSVIFDDYESVTGKKISYAAMGKGFMVETPLTIEVLEPDGGYKSVSAWKEVIERNLFLIGLELAESADGNMKVVKWGEPPSTDPYVVPEHLPSEDSLVSFLMIPKFISAAKVSQVFTSALGPRDRSRYGQIHQIPQANALLIQEKSSIIKQLIDIQREIDLDPCGG